MSDIDDINETDNWIEKSKQNIKSNKTQSQYEE